MTTCVHARPSFVLKGVDPMGQASVDLPDSLEMPPAAALAGTDDLLAQLAGDEIDRLLAEADDDGRAAEETSASTAAPEAAPRAPAFAAEPAATDAEAMISAATSAPT